MSPGWFSDLKQAHERVIRSKMTTDEFEQAAAQRNLQEKFLEHGARIFSALGLFYDDHQELHQLILTAVLDHPERAGERFRKMADNYIARHTN